MTRVATARPLQATGFAGVENLRVNADAEGALLEEIAAPDDEGRAFLAGAAERFAL